MLKILKFFLLIEILFFLLANCTEDIDGSPLSGEYPGDVGMENDPAVIWMEDFEQNNISEMLPRYEDYKNTDGMYFDDNTPALSSGCTVLSINPFLANSAFFIFTLHFLQRIVLSNISVIFIA